MTLRLLGGRSTARGTTAVSARRSAAPQPGQSSTGTGVTGRIPDKGSRKRLKSCIRRPLEANRSRNESKKARWLERAFHSPGGRFIDCFEMLSLLDGLLTDARLHQMRHQILGHLLLVGDF